MDARRVNIPVEENATYIGIIQQKSRDVNKIFFNLFFLYVIHYQDNLNENHEQSHSIKLDWLESKSF